VTDARRQDPRIVAVVVTFNRLALVRRLLERLASVPPIDEVVVVDNASTDGTAELLAGEYSDLEVLRLETNTGGAGGFAAGIERALTLEPDLVWLLDDDTVPTDDGAAPRRRRQQGGLDRRP
jgi:rhamnopyranosyl-N-acetylglucosaminyl-diphospho-decaprenol beta-1,3/1,4-galactofuranosyltransferase